MSRRDTIIVAVLINVGLLVMLFISSIKTPSAAEVAQVVPKRPEPVVKKEEPLVAVPGDKVDKALAASKVVEKEKVVIPVKEEPKVVAVTPPAPKEDELVQTVVVKKGDMLEKIARAHGTTVTEVMRVNKLTSARLQIGQKLVLPEKSTTPVPEKYYVVKNGDNLWKIAIENNMKVDELLRLNNLDENKAKKLRPGDKLLIK